MKVLVTGGAGFIGSNIVKFLERQGDRAIVLDNFSHASYKNLRGVKAEIICGDVTDRALYQELPKVDAVIHEAAVTDTTLADDAKTMAVNYTGSKNVLRYCCAKSIPLVYASSAGVYGESRPPMRETTGLIPHNTYAYSKYIFDCHVLGVMKRTKIPPIIGLRYFNVYGPGEYHKGFAASMTYQLYQQMVSGKRPRIFKHGEQARDFIYVTDVARITVAALRSRRKGILNLGTGIPRSFNDIVASLNAVMETNFKPEYIENPYADRYQNFTQADTTMLQKTLRTSAQFSLEKGIADYVDILKQTQTQIEKKS